MSFIKPISMAGVLDRVGSLDLSIFSRDDVLKIVLQRSRIIENNNARNRAISAWMNGEDAPLLDLIDAIGPEELVSRVARLVYTEYTALLPILRQKPPREVSDIGCGYGLFDLFIAQDFDCKVNLIDLEVSESRHFGFENAGAAYSNLSITRKFLNANGIADEKIKTFNPERDDLSEIRQTDLAVSFLSCGFHYPWATYATFFRDAVVPGGRICLDVRKRVAQEARSQLAAFGPTRVLPENSEPKSVRILVDKVPCDRAASA